MDKTTLRDELMYELQRMAKMDIIVSLREFAEGETAALVALHFQHDRMTPSLLSETLQVSRARTANILRTLRQKGFIQMEMSEEDRRKMYVSLTTEGIRFLEEKHRFLVNYFDLYVEALGETDIAELTRLLRKTVDCEALVKPKET